MPHPADSQGVSAHLPTLNKAPLPATIKQALGSLERRLFIVLASFGIGRLLRNAALLLLILYGLDRLLAPPATVRMVLLALGFAVLAVRAYHDLFAPLRARPPRRDLAAIWESRNPQLGDRLATAVEFAGAHHNASQEMVQAVTAQAAELCAQLNPREVVPTGRAHRSLLTGTAATAILLLGVWAFPDEAAIFIQRLGGKSIAWPSQTTLVLMPAYIDGITEAAKFEHQGNESFSLAVARGAVISLRIRAEGVVPDTVLAVGWSRPRQMHALGGGEFVLRLPPLQEEVTLSFRGGDDTDAYPRLHLRAGDAPSLASWRVTTTPPSYTGLPSEQGNFHELRVLRGTDINIELEPNRATTLVEAVWLDGRRQMLPPDDDDHYSLAFVVAGSDEVRISMTGPDGFRNENVGILKWSATPDRSPEPEILFPVERWLTVPGGSIPLAINAMDDFGLRTVSLWHHAENQEDVAHSLQSPDGRTEFRQLLRLAAPDAFSNERFEDNRFRYLLQASDAAEPQANVATARSPWIEVVPKEVQTQRLSERIITLRVTLEALRDRCASYSEATHPPTTQQVRRLVRELDSVLSSAETLLLERLYSNLDGQTTIQLPVVEQLLRNGRPPAGELTNALLSSPVAAPLDHSGMLLDLCSSLLLARRGPAAEYLASANEDQPNPAAAGDLRDDINRILEILLSWEDYNSAISLLRNLLERQRGLYLRTREASER